MVQGRNVVLESKYGSPRIVNDGVTVAKEVELEDPVENIGAKLVRQVCQIQCSCCFGTCIAVPLRISLDNIMTSHHSLTCAVILPGLQWKGNKQSLGFNVTTITCFNVKFLVQAASKTNDTAGDGTTTATILSAAIIAEGMKIVAAGTNPVQLCRGIETTVAALVKDLQAMSTDVTDADLANVATVSAGGNEVVRPALPPSAISSPFLSKASDQLS